jgi:hypothetical protein
VGEDKGGASFGLGLCEGEVVGLCGRCVVVLYGQWGDGDLVSVCA